MTNINIIQNLIPAGRKNRPATSDIYKGYKVYGLVMKPTTITIHNAYTKTTAKGLSDYCKSIECANRPASWHLSIDENEAWQSVPFNEPSWHAGDGVNGPGNLTSISIEIVDRAMLASPRNEKLYLQAEEYTAKVCAYLIKTIPTLKPFPECMRQHWHWSGKNCPQWMRARSNGWQEFIDKVQKYLNNVPDYKYNILGNSEVTLEQAKQWAKNKGATKKQISIIPVYYKYGELTGINPAILYGQSCHETGFGKFGRAVTEDMNNFAGIKVGRTNAGENKEDHQTFSSIDDGVRAHFNHMSAYVGLPPIGTPHDRYYLVLKNSWAGTVKYLEELSGKWAPSSTYHVNIVKFLNEMLTTTVTDPLPKPPDHLMAITFDDFNPSDYQLAFPALRSFGVMGTSYAHTAPITPQRWAWAREMVAAGWDIQCHTVTHPDLRSLTDQQIHAEMQAVNAVFVTNGLPIPKHHAYPSGLYDTRVINVIKQYRKTGRTVKADTYDGINKDTLNLYELHPIGADVQTEDEWLHLKDRLDQAYKNNRIVITIHHATCEADTPNPSRITTRVNYLRKMVDYAIKKGFKIVTMSQLYALLTGEQPQPEPTPIPDPIVVPEPEPIIPEPIIPKPEPTPEPEPIPDPIVVPEPEPELSFMEQIIYLIAEFIQNIIQKIFGRE